MTIDSITLFDLGTRTKENMGLTACPLQIFFHFLKHCLRAIISLFGSDRGWAKVLSLPSSTTRPIFYHIWNSRSFYCILISC